jgi:hypothetical protein
MAIGAADDKKIPSDQHHAVYPHSSKGKKEAEKMDGKIQRRSLLKNCMGKSSGDHC